MKVPPRVASNPCLEVRNLVTFIKELNLQGRDIIQETDKYMNSTTPNQALSDKLRERIREQNSFSQELFPRMMESLDWCENKNNNADQPNNACHDACKELKSVVIENKAILLDNLSWRYEALSASNGTWSYVKNIIKDKFRKMD